MADLFEGRDFTDAVFWGVDLTNAKVRDVNFTGARMKNVWLVDVDIDGLVDRLVVNGVDVTEFVNKHDPWFALRGMLRPDSIAGLQAALDALDAAWAAFLRFVPSSLGSSVPSSTACRRRVHSRSRSAQERHRRADRVLPHSVRRSIRTPPLRPSRSRPTGVMPPARCDQVANGTITLWAGR